MLLVVGAWRTHGGLQASVAKEEPEYKSERVLYSTPSNRFRHSAPYDVRHLYLLHPPDTPCMPLLYLTSLCELWPYVLFVFVYMAHRAIEDIRFEHTRIIRIHDPNGAEYISFESVTCGILENDSIAFVSVLLTADRVAQEADIGAGSNNGRDRRAIRAVSQRDTERDDLSVSSGSSVTESASAASTSMSGETLVGSDAGTSISGETLVGSEPGTSMSGDTLVGSVDSEWDMLE